MKKSLNELKDEKYGGHAKQNEAFTKSGIFNNFIPIVTESKKTLRSATSLDKTNEEQFEEGFRIVKEFIDQFLFNINKRIDINKVTKLTKDVFKEWQEKKLDQLLKIAEE